jgi:hypothetical protein
MRIGVVVDGMSEYASLGVLLSKVAPTAGQTYLRVVKADIQPLAPFPVIARACKMPVAQLSARGAELVLVIFDREGRVECPSEIADGVSRALALQVDCRTSVIVKDRCYENWLVSDLEALAAHPRRFRVLPRHKRAVEPNRADAADGLAVIRQMAVRGYEKVDDSRTIAESADPARMARHSRSFRKFLREARHPAYSTQSKLP